MNTFWDGALLKEYLELEVNKSFMELQLAYKAVGVLKNKCAAEANLELIGNYFKQGILQKKQIYYPFKFALMKKPIYNMQK
jgi:hypothetical protein